MSKTPNASQVAIRYRMQDYKKRGYLLEDFRLFHQRSQGVTVDYHYHEFCKLLLLNTGSGGYVVDSLRYQIQSGDMVLVDCNSVHRPEFDENTDYERTIIYIDPGFLQRESTQECNLLGCFSNEYGHVLRLTDRQFWQIQDIAHRLEAELAQRRQGHEIIAKALLMELLVNIHRFQQQETVFTSPIQPKNDRILDVLKYLDEHICEDLDIDSLADRFFISKFHLMRLFHKETGATVHSYIIKRRLLMARELIKQGVSATDACYRSGFRSYSAFTRAYSKNFGTTPTGRKDPSIVKSPTYE